MSPAYIVEELHTGRSTVARPILEALPNWFGIEETLEACIRCTDTLRMLVARDCHDNRVIGFISLKPHGERTAEVFVLAVQPCHHRHGCGRALFAATESRLAQQGMRYLTVKTVGPAHPSPHYAKTRRFYEAIGFEGIEIFDTLWAQGVPCLLMIKPIRPSPETIVV